jgi:hypothetical protein
MTTDPIPECGMPPPVPDYHALCAELATRTYALIARTRAALAAVPQGPTDEELVNHAEWMVDDCIMENDKGEIAQSLRAALALHVATIVLLVYAGMSAGVTWPYYVGVGACALILMWEHATVRPGDTARIQAAFGTANGVLSLVFLAGVIAEVAVA